jgi:hypothetical protein
MAKEELKTKRCRSAKSLRFQGESSKVGVATLLHYGSRFDLQRFVPRLLGGVFVYGILKPATNSE